MKNCISRRSFLKAAGILGAAGALAACGGSSASTSTAASTAGSTAASAAASSTSIKLWTYPIGGWGNDETVQGLVSSFNAKYPDIKVTVEYLDYTNGDDQVNTAIEGGSAPCLLYTSWCSLWVFPTFWAGSWPFCRSRMLWQQPC